MVGAQLPKLSYRCGREHLLTIFTNLIVNLPFLYHGQNFKGDFFMYLVIAIKNTQSDCSNNLVYHLRTLPLKQGIVDWLCQIECLSRSLVLPVKRQCVTCD